MSELRITSRQNSRIQQLKKLLTSRKEREKTGLFVADGTKLLAEAVKWSALETVVLSDGVEAALPEAVEVLRVPKEIMEYVSPMETPHPPAGHGAAGRHPGPR